MIKIDNVTKRFGDHKALNHLCLSVPKGSIYGLMGLNGAGKTTIIKHLAGFLVPDHGEITVEGETILDNEALKQRLFIIPDEIFFFRGYDLKEMARYYSDIYKNWNQELFEKISADFELNLQSNLGKFSKGMRKQASFALAMATMPDYLILDEPVDGLDPIVRHKLWRYIMDEVADREMTVLISSHNAKEMEDVCNYIGILSKGEMAFQGDLLEIGDMTIEELFMEMLGGSGNEKQ